MPHCPFCKGAVAEDLLRYGGHCPHCLNEIPGEEAATDPGVQARLRAEQEARAAEARLQRRNRLLSAAGSLLVVAGIGGYMVLFPEPEPLVLDDVEIYIAPATTHRNLASEEAAATRAAQAEEEARRRQEAARRVAAQATSTGSEDLATAGPAPETPSVSTSSGPPEADVSRGMVASPLDLTPKGPGLRGIEKMVASSDSEIKDMAKTVVDANFRQLQQCYESRLKENPELRGRWTVEWTIEKDGTVSDADAKGQGVKDRSFEDCMVRNVEKWKFQAVKEATPLARNFVFSN